MKKKDISKSIPIIMISLVFVSCAAQIRNAKTETAEIWGNCGMCKETIEIAANKKGITLVNWNKDSKIAVITYDSTKTTIDNVLKSIAYAGYDNEKFLAPDDAYNNLHSCCKYDRKVNVVSNIEKPNDTTIKVQDTIKKVSVVVSNPLSKVYASYFALKDALAKDDGFSTSANAKILFKEIEEVQMNKLTASQQNIWMKFEKKLSYDAEHIKGVTELEHQREHFITLSKNMYEIMKVIKTDVPVYYDFCPMANNGKGANWLSLQPVISNPFMGKSMPTCGKIQETILNK